MIDVLLTPAELEGVGAARLAGAQVVVLDVLRATTTIVRALSAGAREVLLFDTLDAGRAARAGGGFAGPVLLAGESKCLKPADFDLGNSPREHVTEKVGGATVLLATTNGTRAAVRARGAKKLFAGAIVNASATAEALLEEIDKLDLLFVCAGTEGKKSLEDALGAGAILFSLLQSTYRADLPFTDGAWLAYHAFAGVRQRLPAALRLGAGGLNLINAGLEDDIDACAAIDSSPLVARIDGGTLRVSKV